MYMTLYYNPKTRKPHGWVITLPVLIPILLTALVVFFGSKQLDKKMAEEARQAQIDVFERF